MFELIKKVFIQLLTDLVNGSNHTKFVLLSNQYVWLILLSRIYILMNTAKNFTTTHSRLS